MDRKRDKNVVGCEEGEEMRKQISTMRRIAGELKDMKKELQKNGYVQFEALRTDLTVARDHILYWAEKMEEDLKDGKA